MVVDIRQVCVSDDDISLHPSAVFEDDAGGTIALDRDLLDGQLVDKARAVLLGDTHQALNDAVHSADGKPHPISQLGVLQHRVGSGRFVRAQPHVNILEGEHGLELVALEIVAQIGIVFSQQFELSQ